MTAKNQALANGTEDNGSFLTSMLRDARNMQRYAQSLPRLASWKCDNKDADQVHFGFAYTQGDNVRHLAVSLDKKCLNTGDFAVAVVNPSSGFIQSLQYYLYKPVTVCMAGALGLFGMMLPLYRNNDENHNSNFLIRATTLGALALYCSVGGAVKLKQRIKGIYAEVEQLILHNKISQADKRLQQLNTFYRITIFLDSDLTATIKFLSAMIAHKNRQTGTAESLYLQALKNCHSEPQEIKIKMALVNLYAKLLRDEKKMQNFLNQILKSREFTNIIRGIKTELKNCCLKLEAGNYAAAKKIMRVLTRQCAFSVHCLDSELATTYYKLRAILLLCGQNEDSHVSRNPRAIGVETRFMRVGSIFEKIRALENKPIVFMPT